MAEIFKPVLVGDSHDERFKWFSKFLEREFGFEAVQAKSFAELSELIDEANDSDSSWGLNKYSLIFVADDLKPAPNRISSPAIVKSYFSILDDKNKACKFVTILIVTDKNEIDFGGVIRPTKDIRIRSIPPRASDYQNCVETLERLKPRVVTAKLSWDVNNRRLREQIRSLSENRDLKDGNALLAQLIARCLDCHKLKTIKVEQLGQGKSGATVFRIIVERARSKNESYLLKLTPASLVDKLETEVRCHLQAAPDLAHAGYIMNLPALRKAHIPSTLLGTQQEPNEYIVRSGRWYAAHFDFVGEDKLGKFIDLETTLTASAHELAERTANTEFSIAVLRDTDTQRIRIFETLLDWLCENWYENPPLLNREKRRMWESDGASEPEHQAMPPYKLPARAKGWIQSFLDGREGMLGERFFPDWVELRDRVLQLVSEDKPRPNQLGQLRVRLPVLLSHVHGDLNATNILLWLDKKHPFLIDFPFYQDAGHALQDFARLEVEIKLALLDRQKDSPDQLKAYEYTYSQMPIWKEMEDRLLADWTQIPTQWPNGTYDVNVRFCFTLIQLLRKRAERVQQNRNLSEEPVDFLSEYLPALLYHTVRAIGYPSLSIFKRLLAVYSAGSILKQLKGFSS